MATLGQKLRLLREKAEMTQKEMANLISVNRVSYTQYENDKRTPPPDTLKKLANIFNVSVDYLLDNSRSHHDGYYIDPEVAELAEELRTNPHGRILFDASRDLTKQDINIVLNLIHGLKEKEGKDE